MNAKNKTLLVQKYSRLHGHSQDDHGFDYIVILVDLFKDIAFFLVDLF